MKIIFSYDFIIGYVLMHSEIKNQAKIITSNILKLTSEDLSFLIKFI
jgi:hypothetical protein